MNLKNPGISLLAQQIFPAGSEGCNTGPIILSAEQYLAP
jgi:hypothetical protein